ncbi:hypothetical protein EDD18DRAFT_1342953 [Armillaria luteobubalina]|uniref:Uncharacterized protein n=1 Tax=Armillaria luteobubalina TaxID=153913 RepID=A0AA39UWN8_9AGAR|nr:hypothetical protein EDD18DRAFT_1342953 [Armillaria luteobubalina]
MSVDTRYSFEEISKHLKELLWNAKPGQHTFSITLKGWDGRLGAALDSQVLLVTPNASVLFQPPMGPYSPKRPHLGCIRKAPIDIRFQPLYGLPLRSHFEELNTCSAITGPGLWSRLKFAQFRGACDLVLHDIEKGTWNKTHKSLIRTYQTYIEMFLERIEGLPLVFECLKVSVAETQRLVLELQAFMDYVSVYQPRMIGTSPRPPEDGQLAVRHLVGVFTMNHTVAQECFWAGIPVWLIYPLASAPTVRIDALDEIQEPVPPFVALSKSRLRV